ncbi:hypothetical protein [Sphingomonas sp.]|uniref:hypothetical protein n=1 Tax=Sphingomonas sp. TaxID=28214 RepID=UPI00333F5653
MANTLDYVAAAVVNQMRQQPLTELTSLQVMREMFGAAYQRDLTEEHADIVARRLEQLGFLERVNDEYAGTYFIPVSSLNILMKTSTIATNEPESQLAKGLKGGGRLLNRVFANPKFWEYFRGELGRPDSIIDEGRAETSEIPASDRIVTLSHNQQIEIEASADALISDVSKENSVGGDGELRQIVLGQLRAGRELIRAQSFKAYLLYQTLFQVLGSLIERYKGQAIAQTAKKLLDLLIEHIFGK